MSIELARKARRTIGLLLASALTMTGLGLAVAAPAQAAPITYTFGGTFTFSSEPYTVTGTFDFDPVLCPSDPCPTAYSNVSLENSFGPTTFDDSTVCDTPNGGCSALSSPAMPQTSTSTTLALVNGFGLSIGFESPLGGGVPPVVDLAGSGLWAEATFLPWDTATLTSAPPTVTTIAPPTGPATGGNTVTISGTGLQPATTVTIGGQTCTSVVVAGDGLSLTCVVSVGTAGANVPVLVDVGLPEPISITGGYTYESASAVLVPNKPRGTKVKGGPTDSNYKVTWKKPTNPAGNRPVTGYRLLVNQKGYSTIILTKNLKASTTSYTLTRKFLKRNAMKPRGDIAGLLRFRAGSWPSTQPAPAPSAPPTSGCASKPADSFLVW
ncbi:MAG: IPT/TIG domain-containing protein [Candidatus Nanopelagicales bacterium]